MKRTIVWFFVCLLLLEVLAFTVGAAEAAYRTRPSYSFDLKLGSVEALPDDWGRPKRNADGTFYPGDGFKISLSIDMTSEEENYVTFNGLEVEYPEDVFKAEGPTDSDSGTWTFEILKTAEPGEYTLKFKAYGTQHWRHEYEVTVCEEVCEAGAIRFEDTDRERELEEVSRKLKWILRKLAPSKIPAEAGPLELAGALEEAVDGLLAELAELGGLIVARDMMLETGFPVFHPGDSLDAAMRRFAFKIKFLPLTTDGSLRLYKKYFNPPKRSLTPEQKEALSKIHSLCPGDIKAVWQRTRFMVDTPTHDELIHELQKEVSYKKGGSKTAIGFGCV